MRKPTILLVDDEKNFTDTFAEFLSERFNADVVVRKSALEAIELVDHQRVDVLFQDMVMPGPSGKQVIDHIKNRNRINEMIVFIISKWNDDKKTLEFEKDDVKYLPKPVSLITTRKVLIEAFETHGGFDYKKK